jgi:hypothetical protein
LFFVPYYHCFCPLLPLFLSLTTIVFCPLLPLFFVPYYHCFDVTAGEHFFPWHHPPSCIQMHKLTKIGQDTYTVSDIATQFKKIRTRWYHGHSVIGKDRFPLSNLNSKLYCH